MRRTQSLGAALVLARMLSPAQPAPSNAAPSEKAEFSADRPGFSLPATVLERGVAQIETGFTFASEREGGTLLHSFLGGTPLVRFGVGGRWEMRAGGDGFLFAETRSTQGREQVNGWSDFGVGAKVSLSEERSLIPAVSLVASLSLPSGKEAFTSTGYDPGAGIIWSKELGHWSAGGLLAFASASENFNRSLQRSTAFSVGFPHAGRTAFYSEVYNVHTGGEAPSSVWMAEGGASRVLGSNFQIDLETGRRLSIGSPGWFVAGGFVFRYHTGWAKR